MKISGIFTSFFGLSLKYGHAAKYSRIAPPGHGMAATGAHFLSHLANLPSNLARFLSHLALFLS